MVAEMSTAVFTETGGAGTAAVSAARRATVPRPSMRRSSMQPSTTVVQQRRSTRGSVVSACVGEGHTVSAAASQRTTRTVPVSSPATKDSMVVAGLLLLSVDSVDSGRRRVSRRRSTRRGCKTRLTSLVPGRSCVTFTTVYWMIKSFNVSTHVWWRNKQVAVLCCDAIRSRVGFLEMKKGATTESASDRFVFVFLKTEF